MIIQYANDVSVYTSGHDLAAMCNAINRYINQLVDFLGRARPLSFPRESTVTLFTPDTKEANLNPQVFIKTKP